jgi:hypothetical protein
MTFTQLRIKTMNTHSNTAHFFEAIIPPMARVERNIDNTSEILV